MVVGILDVKVRDVNKTNEINKHLIKVGTTMWGTILTHGDLYFVYFGRTRTRKLDNPYQPVPNQQNESYLQAYSNSMKV